MVAGTVHWRRDAGSSIPPRTIEEVSRVNRQPKQSRLALQIIILFILSSSSVPAVRADDWPQWLGPHRDGIWRETGILRKFNSKEPKLRWRASIGGGYAGPAVA